MAEIVKVYKQDVPATRFIGKKYGESDRINGTFGKRWGDWFQNSWFEAIVGENSVLQYEDGDAYIGLMRCKECEPFEYWIGIFMPVGTTVPEGFACLDFPKATLGVCWVYGKEDTIYKQCHKCRQKIEETGYKITKEEWLFERYACPRFTTPDEHGKVILDICFFVE
jgi:predicted transcriptional regulator YdeE